MGRIGEVPCEDIIRNGCDTILISKGEAELEHQSCFAGADWSTDTGRSAHLLGINTCTSSSAKARRFFQFPSLESSIPTNAHRERSLGPISAFDDRHLPVHVGARPIEYLMRVAVFCGVELVGVSMGAEPVM